MAGYFIIIYKYIFTNKIHIFMYSTDSKFFVFLFLNQQVFFNISNVSTLLQNSETVLFYNSFEML